ncbi:MAG: 5-formyltetrahydrofolate cyclo-ligase [Clostridia bacterium]|nr:5-formyltetrahydrofolate cyclo-ligase [Clostridia bacterium]
MTVEPTVVEHRGSTDEAAAKERLRREMRAWRGHLSPSQVRSWGEAATANLEAQEEFRTARVVLVYASTPGEVPTWGLIRRALARGQVVAVPFVPPAGRPARLEPRRILDPEVDLVPGPLRVPGPDRGRTGPVTLSAVECAVVPGLAFGRDGSRLGHGRGYYDRLLRALPPSTRRLGLAFAGQVFDSVPHDDSDEPVHVLVTERDVLRR